ncbi:MAG TPA: zf-HC2 domain-containing protein [Actinomycetota bacterium]|nr:zf-HC2 domain-containing protein [Actinomycetota bacterium]
MTHPGDELLAAYVDGALTEPERSAVAAHLDACPACREEVGLAAQARGALRALPEEPVPLRVTGPVLREVRGADGDRRSRVVRWLSGAAVAAAVVAVLAVALPELGQRGAAPPAAEEVSAPQEAGLPAAAASPALPSLERSDRDYRPEDLEALAGEATAGAGGPVAAEAKIPPATARALECVLRGSDLTPDDQVVRLIDARFQGTPAYLAVALRGPGAGQPPTKVVVWVVAKERCGPLAYSQDTL